MRLIAEHPDVLAVMRLLDLNVPWDVIMGMDRIERQGFCIAGGLVHGGEFDWRTKTWKVSPWRI